MTAVPVSSFDTSKYANPYGYSDAKLEQFARLDKSSITFGRVVMPTLFYKQPGAFQYEIDDLLEDNSARYSNIIAPRDHAKSTIISNAFPAKRVLGNAILHGRKEFIIIISKTSRVSDRLLGTIKYNLNYNVKLRAIYGAWGEDTALQWAQDVIELKNHTLLMSRGLMQNITGIKHLELRPTLVIIDDPQDKDNTKTKMAMDDAMDWLLSEVLNLLDKDLGRCIVVGTPKHELSMVWQLRKNKMFRTLHYDAIVEERTDVVKGKVLWPERYTYDEIDDKRKVALEAGKLYRFYSEHRCQIVGSDEQMFKPKYIKYYKGNIIWKNARPYLDITHLGDYANKGELEKLEKTELRPVVLFTGVDPASSVMEAADFSVIFTIAVDINGNFFCLPYFRRRVTPVHLCEAIEKECDFYKPSLLSIETVGYQEMIRDYLRNVRELYMPGLGNKHVPRTEKSRRLERLQPYFYHGKVYLTPEMEAFEGELFLYPRSGTYDLMDGFDLATQKVWRPTHGVDTVEDVVTKREKAEISEDWMLS